MTDATQVLQALMDVIEQRRRNPSPQSYTSQLLVGGVDAIGAKVLEEAGELIEASRELQAARLNAADGETPGPAEAETTARRTAPDRKHVIHEAADLVYHTWVLLSWSGVSIADVAAELERRFGTSGLAEKAARKRPTDSPSQQEQ